MNKPDAKEFIVLNGVTFTHGDVHAVVDGFYTAVAIDPMLKVPFHSVKDWPHHIERMTHFWWIRLGGDPYMEGMYSPVSKHFAAGFNAEFLKRWLTLFQETQEKILRPEQVKIWIFIAHRIGEGLTIKNEYYRNQHRA